MADLRKGYWVELVPFERTDGQLAVSLVAKRTFQIPVDAAEIKPLEDDEQPDFLYEDRYDEGDAETAPPTLEYELVGEKGGVDVVVVGAAYAPGGKPQPEFECAIRVADKLRRLRIIGPRKAIWVPPKKGRKKDGEPARPVPQPPRFTEPEPVAKVALSYANAYGGRTRVIPDDETLRIMRAVNEVMEEEGREEKERKDKEKEKKKREEDKRKKEEQEQAMLDEAVGALSEEDEKLLRARGQFGYDDEGVRLAGVATSQRGTAVMDVDAFEKWQAAQDKLEEQGRLTEEEKKLVAAMRRNARGEALVIDDGVEILTDDKLAEELAQAREEQQEHQRALAAAAEARRRERVTEGDGTKMLDISALDEGDDAWEGRLREELSEEDQEAEEARLAAIKERKKREEEALAEFPELPCPTNPYGKGFYVSPVKQVVDRLELPLIEDPDAPLTPRDLRQDIMKLEEGVPLPAGFSTYPRHAIPRIGFAGAYPSDMATWEADLEESKRRLDLEDEDDVATLRELDKRRKPGQIDRRYFNSASPTLQFKRLAGDEEITLTNLSAEGTLYFRLPRRSLQAELDRGAGVERQDMALDTVVIEPDERKVTLLWRAHFPLPSWEALGEYPQMVGWVLDLDIEDRRRKDWEEAARKARGDGTAILDISELDLEGEDPYWRTISDERRAREAAALAAAGGALDIERMGLHRRVEDEDWVAEASEGTVDVSADKKKAEEEQAYLEKKQEALKKLEEKEKAEAERREEVAEAAAAGKPIPPKDADKTPKQLKAKKAAAAKKAKAAAGGPPKPMGKPNPKVKPKPKKR